MSHFHERAEKICLNCGAQLYDRYCHKCGQENVEPKQNFWQLTAHFLEDLTHFDGKFFTTIKYLFFKPGFLTEEYIKGRRASHINPIRMYLFISAAFFLILMSFFVPRSVHVDEKKAKHLDTSFRNLARSTTELTNSFSDTTDSDNIPTIATDSGTWVIVNGDTILDKDDNKGFLPYETVAEYDSVQNALPKKERDGAVKHYFRRKLTAAREVSRKSDTNFVNSLRANFFHTMPYMLFLSLPIIALLLKLLYIRRKQFFYVSHIIFVIHYYCFFFLTFLIIRTLHNCGSVASAIASFLNLGYFVYLYVAMLRFYKQGWFKTFVKFGLLWFIGSFIIFFMFLLLGINALLNVGAH